MFFNNNCECLSPVFTHYYFVGMGGACGCGCDTPLTL